MQVCLRSTSIDHHYISMILIFFGMVPSGELKPFSRSSGETGTWFWVVSRRDVEPYATQRQSCWQTERWFWVWISIGTTHTQDSMIIYWFENSNTERDHGRLAYPNQYVFAISDSCSCGATRCALPAASGSELARWQGLIYIDLW